MRVTRREILAGASSAIALGAAPALGQTAATFRILFTDYARRLYTGGKAGDIAGEWASANNRQLEFITFPTVALHERLFREASLASTTINLAIIADRYCTPRISSLFHPLDDFLRDKPIEDIDDLSANMRARTQMNGKTYGIPFRALFGALHYNEVLLAERGLNGPPKTMEDVVEYARKLTFRRDDGSQVIGLSLDGTLPAQIVDFLRAWGGEYITQDYKVKVSSPESVKAVSILADLFQSGAIPKAFVGSWTNETATTYMQQGLCAMSLSLFERYPDYNHPERSKYSGKIKVMPIPMAREVKSASPIIAPRTEFWSFVIPKNAQDKELAYDFIRTVSDRKNTLRAAINGNGPARVSTYKDSQMRAALPYADMVAQVVPTAIAAPAWDNSARAEDAFKQGLESALIGRKTAQAAMEEVAARVTPLLPK
jgi:multiple sugar transport system substrate-binding protein